MKWINGNKTIIGEILVIALLVFKPKLDEWSPDAFIYLMSLVGTLTGVAAGHHIKKQVKKAIK